MHQFPKYPNRLYLFWFLMRGSIAEKQEALLEYLEEVKKGAESYKIYPYLHNLEFIIAHQAHISVTRIPVYTIYVPPRFTGIRHKYLQIPTDSDYFIDTIQYLCNWSALHIAKTIEKLHEKRAEALQSLYIERLNEPAFPYWGRVQYGDDKSVYFKRLIGNQNGISFSEPSGDSPALMVDYAAQVEGIELDSYNMKFLIRDYLPLKLQMDGFFA